MIRGKFLGGKNAKDKRLKDMGINAPIIITDIREGEQTRTIIPPDVVKEKKFNCDEQGNPINSKILDHLGVKYEC